jgi:UTP:GlnB (protein PII) uridylyltransferase
MVLGISANDRPGLLHDISQALNRLRVQLLHCEASCRGIEIRLHLAIASAAGHDDKGRNHHGY